jgi:RNA polymerase sigma-70 factor (ECF subfamily)
VFLKGREREAARPIPFDPDRAAVEAARLDAGRFEALYRKYVAQIYTFALYETRDHHAAEDLTEQVFLNALRGLSGFRELDPDGRSSFRVWLFQIARNLLANNRRTDRRHPTAPLELASTVAAPDDPAQAAIARDEAERVWRAVDQLPDERRRAVLLRFVDELSAAEIGDILGRSEGSVRVLIHRALKAVGAELSRAGSGTSRDVVTGVEVETSPSRRFRRR